MALRLKRIREEQGISQNALSKRSGVSRPMIHHIENGTRNPTVIVVHALASALMVELPYLFAPEDQSDTKRK